MISVDLAIPRSGDFAIHNFGIQEPARFNQATQDVSRGSTGEDRR